MRYFKIEYADPETGDKVSDIHAISGDVSSFLEHAKETAEEVVELKEKDIDCSDITC